MLYYSLIPIAFTEVHPPEVPWWKNCLSGFVYQLTLWLALRRSVQGILYFWIFWKSPKEQWDLLWLIHDHDMPYENLAMTDTSNQTSNHQLGWYTKYNMPKNWERTLIYYKEAIPFPTSCCMYPMYKGIF